MVCCQTPRCEIQPWTRKIGGLFGSPLSVAMIWWPSILYSLSMRLTPGTILSPELGRATASPWPYLIFRLERTGIHEYNCLDETALRLRCLHLPRSTRCGVCGWCQGDRHLPR